MAAAERTRGAYGESGLFSDGPAGKRQQIEALYAQHNPEKLADVDKLVAKYGEEKLLGMVRKKYGSGRTATASTQPEPTGKAAAAALQDHIRQRGTQDVKTIDRLRRASLQPDSLNAGARPKTSVADAMAAAMAEVDAEEDAEEQAGAAPPGNSTPTVPPASPAAARVLAVQQSDEAEVEKAPRSEAEVEETPRPARSNMIGAAELELALEERTKEERAKAAAAMERVEKRHKREMDDLQKLLAVEKQLKLTLQQELDAQQATITELRAKTDLGATGTADASPRLEALEAEAEARAADMLAAQVEDLRAQLANSATTHASAMETRDALFGAQQATIKDLQAELDAQQATITELRAKVDLGAIGAANESPRLNAVEAEAEARAVDLAEQLMAEKDRAATQAEQLLQQQRVLQGEIQKLTAELDASESALRRDAEQSAERHVRSLAAAEEAREAEGTVVLLELTAQVEDLRAQLANSAATHASAMETRNAELELLKAQLAGQVKLTHVQQQADESQDAGIASDPSSRTEPFCVKCASRKSESARSDLDSRQAELMRQRTEMLARMEKTRATERIKAMEAKLVAENTQRVAAVAEVTHAQEKANAAQELLHRAEGEIQKLTAELKQSDQDLTAQRAQFARMVKDSAENQEAAVVGAVAASAAKHAVELSTEQSTLQASVQQAKDLAEQELKHHQASAARDLENARSAAAAASEQHSLTTRQIQGDLELVKAEAARLRAELEESRQAHAELASSHEAALGRALTAAEGKHLVELTQLRSELETRNQQSRSEMAAKMDEMLNRGVNEVEAVRSELSLELRNKSAEYAKEIAAIKEELRMAQDVIETETSLRLQIESDKDNLEQLALVDRDHLSHEAAMSVELAQAATEAVVDAQRTAEEMARHHTVEILALRTTSTTEIGELERCYESEMSTLRLELDTIRTSAEKEKHDTMSSTAREMQQMQARSAAEQFEAAEEASKRLEHAQALHLAAIESARQQAAVKEEQHAAEVQTLRQTTDTVRQEVLRLREECQEVRNTSARQLAELAASHKAELEHANATAEARHALEMSTLTNSMKATMNQSKAKLTTEMEDLRERGATELESLRTQLTSEIRTNANEYARKLAALNEQLESAKEVILKETKHREQLEVEAVELNRKLSTSAEEGAQLKTSLSSVTEDTASALAEAHSHAVEISRHHETEMAALRAQFASEIEQLTNVHRLEMQSLQSEIASTKMSCEQKIHEMTMQSARNLEEVQARHSSAEEQTSKQTAEAMEQIKLAHAAALDVAKTAADAAAEQHEAALDAMRSDCEAQRLEVVRVQTELQDVRGLHAAELEELQDSHAAAAAGIAAAAAAQQAADMAAHNETTEETIQRVHDDAALKIELAREQAEQEMADLRSELTSQVRSTATSHAEHLEATVQEMREAKAESEAAMQRRVEIEVEIERVQAAAELQIARATAAATIQAKFRRARAERNMKDVRVSLIAEHGRCKQVASDNEMKLSNQAAEIVAEAKQMSQSMQQTHQMELIDARSSADRELEEVSAKHAEHVATLHSEFSAQQAEAESALTTCRDEHAQELQSLTDAHAAAKTKSEEQKAAWLADVQAAMKRSIAAMESASATTAAKHDEEITKMEARVRRAEAEANHFRTAHAQEVEEKNSVATKQQDALDEHKVMKTALEQAQGRANRHLDEVEDKMAKIAELEEQLEINKSAFMLEKDALMQTHKEELAKIEAMQVETMQASASRLADVQASNRRSVEAMEAAQVAAADNHAAAVQVLQAEGAAARRSSEIARITDTVALGGAACTLEIKWRERHADLEAAGKAALAEVVRDSEAKIADMQRENEAALEVMMHQLRLETVKKVKSLEDSHREELDAMQNTWRAEVSLSGLQQSLADAQSRAEKLSEKKKLRRVVKQPASADPWTPKPSDAALIGRSGQDPQGHNGRMEVRVMSHGTRSTGAQGTPKATARVTAKAPGPSPTVTPRQVQAEQKAVQRLGASATRPKAKAQSVRRKKATTVSAFNNGGGESLSIRSTKSPAPVRVGRSATVNARSRSRSGQTRGSSHSPRSPRSGGSFTGSPVRARATTPGGRIAETFSADVLVDETEEALAVHDAAEEEEEEEEYIEELDDEEQQALAELRKRLGRAEAQIDEARNIHSLSTDVSSADAMEQSASFSTLEQQLEQAKADAMDGLASPISPIAGESEAQLRATSSEDHFAEHMDDDEDGRMAIAWARVRRGEASGYVQASSDTPRLLEKARRATEQKGQQHNI